MVKKQSMDGSVMSDEIDGENMVEIFEGNPKSLQKLFDSDHLQFEKKKRQTSYRSFCVRKAIRWMAAG